MALDLTALFRRVRTLSAYSQLRAFEEAVGGDGDAVATVMWEGVARGLWAPSHSLSWQYMASPGAPRTGALLAKLLTDAAARGLDADITRWVATAPHVFVFSSFWRLVEPTQRDLAPLVPIWSALPEPLRLLAGFTLVRVGELPPSALDDADLRRIADSWVDGAPHHADQTREGFGDVGALWPSPRWSVALCGAAAARTPHNITDALAPWLAAVPPSLRLDALCKSHGAQLERAVAMMRGDPEVAAMLPARAVDMRASMKNPYDRPWSLALVTALLESLGAQGTTLDEALDDLVASTMWQRYEPLTRALRWMPEGRRARVIVKSDGYFHVDACPTPEVLDGVVAALISGRFVSEHSMDHRDLVTALARHPQAARGAVLRALPGSSHPQRHRLVQTLVDAPTPEAIPVLVGLLTDRGTRHGDVDFMTGRVDTTLRDVPVFAAKALSATAAAHGEGPVLAALDPMLRAKKVDARSAGVAALAALPKTDAVRALATSLATKERSATLRATLASV